MITNLLVIVFILLTVFWFSTQGLFSALLHLVVLLCAGALALAAWEPLTLGYLLERMPEYAWGVGLLAPFALILLIGRIVIDMAVPGNMEFHPLVNNIAGGLLGFVIGMLTSGLIIIGAQFIGGFDLGGYQPYTLQEGKLVRTGHLWLGADDFADSVFTTLSGGAFYPMNGNTLAKIQPSLVEAAGAFSQPARQYARRSIRPANVEVTRQFALDTKQLPKELRPTAGGGLTTISTRLNLTGTGKTAGAADSDGMFTANAAQVSLIATDANGQSQVIPAGGYVVSNSFGTLVLTGEFARAGPQDQVDIDWLFAVPSDLTPAYLRIKQVRIPLTDVKPTPPAQVAQWMADVEWVAPAAPAAPDENTPPPTSTNMEPQRGVGAGVEGIEIKVMDLLPVVLSDNWLSSRANNVQTRDKKLVSAEGLIRIEPDRVDANLAINHIDHPDNVAIVRVQMTDARARSLYGQALQLAGQLQAPMLVADDGSNYSAIGYVRYNPASDQIYLRIDTSSPIRSMKEIDIDRLADGEALYLYFRTARGIHLKAFKLGGASTQEITVNVP